MHRNYSLWICGFSPVWALFKSVYIHWRATGFLPQNLSMFINFLVQNAMLLSASLGWEHISSNLSLQEANSWQVSLVNLPHPCTDVFTLPLLFMITEWFLRFLYFLKRWIIFSSTDFSTYSCHLSFINLLFPSHPFINFLKDFTFLHCLLF